ncbi:unnamed protein product, partial [Symbiodinium sp. CCMP2592]
WPALLTALMGREDGHVYYSTEPILKSPTADWVIRCVESMEQAYARLQLLLTPSFFK